MMGVLAKERAQFKNVLIKPEPEVQRSRNSDLQYKSKAFQRSCKHLLSQGSH